MQDSEGQKFDNVSSLAFRVLSSDAKLLLCGVPCSAQGPEQASQQLPSVHIPGQRKSFQSLPLIVEGLYCKRPIQCLVSSEILTPPPLTARRVCTTLAVCVLAGWRGGGGVNSLEDARHCSVLYICKYFVPLVMPYFCMLY
jgi:hypothetical protein